MAEILCAQEEKKSKNNLFGGFGYMDYSASVLNYNQINGFLVEKSYNEIKKLQHGIGGGGGFIISNFYIGGQGGNFFKTQLQNSNNNLTIEGGFGFFDFGYAICFKKRNTIIPTIGIGGGGYTIKIQNKQANNDFSEQLASPSGSAEFESGGMLVQPQILYKCYAGTNESEGFFIGIKTGYRYSIGNWKPVGNTSLQNTPSMNMDGFFLGLVLGGGSVKKFNNQK